MKKRIFICTSEFKSEKNFDGGISSHFYRLAKELNTKYDVTIVTSSDKSGDLIYDGLKIIRVKIFNIFTKFFLKITDKNKFQGEIFARPFFCLIQSYFLNRKIAKILDSNSIIIYSSYQYLNFFQKQDWKSIVYIWSIQKEWNFVNPNSIFQKIDTYFENKSFSIAKKIISVSKLLINKIDNNFQNKTLLIRPLYIPTNNYNDLQNFNKNIILNNGKYFLYFGSMIKRKGIDLIFQILPNLIEKYPDYKFLFCGSNSKFDGFSKREILENYKKSYPENISIFESLPHNDLFLLIKNSKIVVMPTYIDTVPSMSLEALDHNATILCSSNSSIDEYITNNKNGFIFENGNANDLFKKIIHISNLNEDKISEIKNKGRDTLKEYFSEENTLRKLEEIINEI